MENTAMPPEAAVETTSTSEDWVTTVVLVVGEVEKKSRKGPLFLFLHLPRR